MTTFRPPQAFAVQVTYKPDNYGNAETELIRFQNSATAQTFLESILKNPDVQSAKMV